MKVQIGKRNAETNIIDDAPECNEVFGVYVAEHPKASLGVPKRVAVTGVVGNLCFIKQHGLLEPEMEKVFEAVKAWKEVKSVGINQGGNSCCE